MDRRIKEKLFQTKPGVKLKCKLSSLQEVAQRYVRNHRLPPTYGRSTSSYNGDYLYEYEEISSDITQDQALSRQTLNEELA